MVAAVPVGGSRIRGGGRNAIGSVCACVSSLDARISVKPINVPELLVSRARMAYRIAWIMRGVAVLCIIAAWITPNARLLGTLPLAIAITFEILGRHSIKARAIAESVVADARLVYWAELVTVRIGDIEIERLHLHLRNGAALELPLRPNRLRMAVAWLTERNPSMRFGSRYDGDTRSAILANGPPPMTVWPPTMPVFNAAARRTAERAAGFNHAFDVLLRAIARRLWAWRVLKYATMIAVAVAFNHLIGAPWRAILFVSAMYCFMKCLLIATNGEAAIKVVHDPTLVYWVQYPAKRPFAVWRWFFGQLERAYLHLRDGGKVEVCLSSYDVRAVVASFAERNRSIRIGATYADIKGE